MDIDILFHYAGVQSRFVVTPNCILHILIHHEKSRYILMIIETVLGDFSGYALCLVKHINFDRGSSYKPRWMDAHTDRTNSVTSDVPRMLHIILGGQISIE